MAKFYSGMESISRGGIIFEVGALFGGGVIFGDGVIFGGDGGSGFTFNT